MLDAGAVAEEGPPNNVAARRPLRAHRHTITRPLELAEPERINPDLLENLEALGYME